MTDDVQSSLADWRGVPRPPRARVDGRYAALVPLDAGAHAADLFAASAAPQQEDLPGGGLYADATARFRYLPDEPPASEAAMRDWIAQATQQGADDADPLFFAVVDLATGRAEGRQAIMRVDEANGVAELGHIMWGPNLARTRAATEAVFLTADQLFGLGYRRFEWK